MIYQKGHKHWVCLRAGCEGGNQRPLQVFFVDGLFTTRARHGSSSISWIYIHASRTRSRTRTRTIIINIFADRPLLIETSPIYRRRTIHKTQSYHNEEHLGKMECGIFYVIKNLSSNPPNKTGDAKSWLLLITIKTMRTEQTQIVRTNKDKWIPSQWPASVILRRQNGRMGNNLKTTRGKLLLTVVCVGSLTCWRMFSVGGRSVS